MKLVDGRLIPCTDRRSTPRSPEREAEIRALRAHFRMQDAVRNATPEQMEQIMAFAVQIGVESSF